MRKSVSNLVIIEKEIEVSVFDGKPDGPNVNKPKKKTNVNHPNRACHLFNISPENRQFTLTYHKVLSTDIDTKRNKKKHIIATCKKVSLNSYHIKPNLNEFHRQTKEEKR